MARYRDSFPHVDALVMLAYVGMETDLIFTQGIDLPGFASYPLLEHADGRQRLLTYYRDLITLGTQENAGVILESPTWVANRDRGAELGYTPETLMRLNQEALALMAQARVQFGDAPTVLSANIGPRNDAYAPDVQMTADAAEQYHAEQISALAQTEVDVISAYTLAYPAEAIGITRTARHHGLPVVIAFTVETDGRLPTGASLQDAIAEVDAATDAYAAYFMINCAHPDHFEGALSDAAWMSRVKGLVANASRCSHAELDNADTLDDGDPEELADQLAGLKTRFPHLQVFGGCCGTDMRHMTRIAKAVRQATSE
ncbi:homocysteine S-methyltransferase family protein [Marivita sp. S6314]|uniref:homocysteine S-methyltransferase family protein n=1 Tax=Marivita sp. S6314 TaxID=2926406 RepID=UPI001FF60C71|nr:homocysteine S-methyltransferase family protein [Marivita sp. S6314]MCK0151172.1 homocysteine S-methyltransferase family protein [Marivita sp. S6314]